MQNLNAVIGQLVVEQLEKKKHDRKSFDCGVTSLTRFLKELSGQYDKRNISRTYVGTLPPSNQVIGYYSISTAQVDYERVSLEQFPRHPTGIPLPCALIGKLAVDKSCQKKHIGQYLLIHALKQIAKVSDEIGIHAVLVQAIDDNAKRFYERYGFRELEKNDNEYMLVIGIKTIKSSFSK